MRNEIPSDYRVCPRGHVWYDPEPDAEDPKCEELLTVYPLVQCLGRGRRLMSPEVREVLERWYIHEADEAADAGAE